MKWTNSYSDRLVKRCNVYIRIFHAVGNNGAPPYTMVYGGGLTTARKTRDGDVGHSPSIILYV